MIALLGCLLAVGCGGGSDSPADRIVGNWLYTNTTDSAGFGATFEGNGTYSLSSLELTTATTARAAIEKGTYTATDSTITTTPQKSTCPGPVPVDTVTYELKGSTLVVTTGANIIVMTRNRQSADTSFVVTLGCFAEDGSFAASPLAPVSN